jgi:hypothetical protein
VRKHKWKLLALAGLAVVAVAASFALWPRPDRVTRENYDRVKKGMSRTEVEAILGPPGDYSTGPLTFGSPNSAKCLGMDGRLWAKGTPVPGSMALRGVDSAEWRTNEKLMVVHFMESEFVAGAVCHEVSRVDQSPFGNFIWRAKRQWHRWFP